MKSRPFSLPIWRRVPLAIAVLGLSFLAGCMSLDSLNQFESEWDQKYAPTTGVTGSRLVQAISVLATYEATLKQRQIAEQRARNAYARMLRDQQAEVKRRQAARARKTAQATPKVRSKGGSAETTLPSTPQALPDPEPAPKLAAQIAVEVPPEKGQDGASTVMLWDTNSQRLVGNEVYALSKTPPKGSNLALWSGAPTHYVGKGN